MKKFSSLDILKLRDTSCYKDMSSALTFIADVATGLTMKVEAARVAIAVLNFKIADYLGYAELSDKHELIKNFDCSVIDAGLSLPTDNSYFNSALHEQLLIAQQWLNEDKDKDEDKE